MKVLIIDRDTLSVQLLRSRLEALGHEVTDEAVKNTALAKLEKEKFDAVFVDPSPLSNARPMVSGIRRAMKSYGYVVLMSHDMDRDDALRSGANDLLKKPQEGGILDEMMETAGRLTRLIERIGDESEDFPSAGGVIAKSAFNQLFLSCMDRADRYAERSYLVFIGILNYRDILGSFGGYAAEYATAKLSQYLVRLRRQSDIIAQTGKGEYCLMLQRPAYESEPLEAANRFAEALGRLDDICAAPDVRVDVYVRLIELPLGRMHVEHIVNFESTAVARKV